MQVVNFRLAGDIAATGEQRFRQLQLLTILSFKGIQRQNKADLLLLNGRQPIAAGAVAQRNIFQQRLLLHCQRGELRLHAGQRLRHGIQTHTQAGGSGVE